MIWYDIYNFNDIMIWNDMIWFYDMVLYDIVWYMMYDMIWLYDIMIWYMILWHIDMIWYDMIWTYVSYDHSPSYIDQNNAFWYTSWIWNLYGTDFT